MSDEILGRQESHPFDDDELDYQNGLLDGERWASSQAKPIELERLENLRDQCSGHDWDMIFSESDTDAFGCHERFYFMIDPDCDKDREAAVSFWESILAPGETATAGFVKGFAEGAVSLGAQGDEQA